MSVDKQGLEAAARLKARLADYDADLVATIAAGILPDREAYGEDVSGVTYTEIENAADALSQASPIIASLKAEVENLTQERDSILRSHRTLNVDGARMAAIIEDLRKHRMEATIVRITNRAESAEARNKDAIGLLRRLQNWIEDEVGAEMPFTKQEMEAFNCLAPTLSGDGQ